MARIDFFLGFGASILNTLFGTLILMGIAFSLILTVGLIVVSVRFMLTTTRAAQVYIDLNAADAARARAGAARSGAHSAATSGAAKPGAAKSRAASKPSPPPKG